MKTNEHEEQKKRGWRYNGTRLGKGFASATALWTAPVPWRFCALSPRGQKAAEGRRTLPTPSLGCRAFVARPVTGFLLQPSEHSGDLIIKAIRAGIQAFLTLPIRVDSC